MSIDNAVLVEQKVVEYVNVLLLHLIKRRNQDHDHTVPILRRTLLLREVKQHLQAKEEEQ